MDFKCLPIELKKMIISYLDTKSLKKTALVSKELKFLSFNKLWSKPRFTKKQDIYFFMIFLIYQFVSYMLKISNVHGLKLVH